VNSLQKRLQLGLAASVVLLMVLLWWLAGSAIEKFGEDFVQSRLVHDADSLLSSLQLDETGELKITPGRMSAIYQKPFSGHYFVVQTANKTIYSRSLWDETLVVPPFAAGADPALDGVWAVGSTTVDMVGWVSETGASFYHRHRGRLVGVTGEPGALQLVFCRFVLAGIRRVAGHAAIHCAPLVTTAGTDSSRSQKFTIG
jgi:hypothetical protein